MAKCMGVCVAALVVAGLGVAAWWMRPMPMTPQNAAKGDPEKGSDLVGKAITVKRDPSAHAQFYMLYATDRPGQK